MTLVRLWALGHWAFSPSLLSLYILCEEWIVYKMIYFHYIKNVCFCYLYSTKSTNSIEYHITNYPSIYKRFPGIKNEKSRCLLRYNTSQESKVSFLNKSIHRNGKSSLNSWITDVTLKSFNFIRRSFHLKLISQI